MSVGQSLPDKVLALDEALAEVPHAFGGALALAYYAEPRATVDIDLNVFVRETEAERAIAPLVELGVDADAGAHRRAAEAGQVRLLWGTTPVDLFFSYDAFHDAAAGAVRRVPFADRTIPVLAAEHLAVCKAVFDRRKDWVDIEAMLEAGTHVDADEVLRWTERVLGSDDARHRRLARLLRRSL